MIHLKQVLSILFFLMVFVCEAKDYYVSKKGSDHNSGTKKAPFLSIQKAAEVMEAGDICYISAGIYTETIVPKNSGKQNNPIVFRPFSKNDRVIITGTDPITKQRWERVSKNVFKVNIELTFGHENQVFLNEKTMVEARWPNLGEDLLKPVLSKMGKGSTAALIIDNQLPKYNYAGAKIWIHASKYWSNWTTNILSTPSKNQLRIINNAPFEGDKQHVAAEGAEYFIFSCKDALDKENEWFYDDDEHELYIYRSDGKLPKDTYYVKTRMNALDLRNTSHIHFYDIQVFGATIETDKNSNALVFDNLSVFYPYYSSLANLDLQQKSGQLVKRLCG